MAGAIVAAGLIIVVNVFGPVKKASRQSAQSQRVHALWETCAFCHSPDGLGFVGFDAPKIAGQNAWYTVRQLKKFKIGQRGYHPEDIPGKQMAVSTGPLTNDGIIKALADYIERLPVSPTKPKSHWLTVLGPKRPYEWKSSLAKITATAEPSITRGKELYETCAACHGESGRGKKELGAPRLDNKQVWYLQRQLKYFKAGARGKAPDDEFGQQMAAATEVLPDDQAIVDVVGYIMTFAKGPFDHDNHGLDFRTIAGLMWEGLTKKVSSWFSQQNLVEVTLIEKLADEPRGWCIDAAGHQTRAIMAGGVHGHTCYSYEGRGNYRVAADQGFLAKEIKSKTRFNLAAFNHCLTLSAPQENSWIALKPCDNSPEQGFRMEKNGRIVSSSMPHLCITLGAVTLPGGGGSPVHQLRNLTMQRCVDDKSKLQRWRLRNKKDW